MTSILIDKFLSVQLLKSMISVLAVNSSSVHYYLMFTVDCLIFTNIDHSHSLISGEYEYAFYYITTVSVYVYIYINHDMSADVCCIILKFQFTLPTSFVSTSN